MTVSSVNQTMSVLLWDPFSCGTVLAMTEQVNDTANYCR